MKQRFINFQLGRIENDLKWNYGFKICNSPMRFDTYEFQLWCFRQDKVTKPCEMVKVSKGFMMYTEFGLSDRIFSFRLPRIRARIM